MVAGSHALRSSAHLALALALGLGCSEPPAPRAPERLEIPDASDRCRVVREGCPGFEDDGCPDVVFASACEPDARTSSLLREAAEEMRCDPRYARVAVRGDAQSAACALDALVSHGVDAGRLHLEPSGGQVGLEVSAWDGRDCRTGGPTTTPGS